MAAPGPLGPFLTAPGKRMMLGPQDTMRASNPQAGFSLIEILVAVIIITIFASIVTLNVINKPAQARVDAARLEIANLRSAVELYKLEQTVLPTTDQGLEALVSKPTRPPVPRRYPQGGYLGVSGIPRDPWGNQYIYLVPGPSGQPFEIISYGSDGEPGGTGDAADLSSADG
jgi:general secretion pathway protein G